jgi:hypothetical protein
MVDNVAMQCPGHGSRGSGARGAEASGSILSRSNPLRLADAASPGSDVQLSTCEAEYVMLCYACMPQAEWLRLLLATLGVPQDGPTVIYEDSEAACYFHGTHTV